MPLEDIQYDNKKFMVVLPNKRHEPAYRKRLTSLIKEKYGEKIAREQILNALLGACRTYFLFAG